MIWRYDLDLKDCKRLPIKVVAQERGFYTDAVERRLSEHFEGPAQKPLKRLAAGDRITQEDRKRLARYILCMWNRGPRMRARMDSWIPDMMEMAVAGREVLPSGEERQSLEDSLRTSIREVPISQRLVLWIEAMKWRILFTEDPNYFVTCDCPVYFFDQHYDGVRVQEILFPLSRTTTLVCAPERRREGFGLMMAAPEHLRKIRRHVVSVATRFVFSPVKEDWIRQVAEEERTQRREEGRF